jgi:hypothetical protein
VRYPIIALLLLTASMASADTTITYQGQLQDQSGPLSDIVEMEFRLYDSLTGGTQIGTPVTHVAVPVSDGLFQVELGFGGGAFDGSERWLEVIVDGQALEPRQPITAAPMAHFALAGNEGPEGPPGEDGADGAENAWGREGTAGTHPASGQFLGTIDDAPLEIRVDSQRAIRLEPADVPNVIGGWGGNTVATNVFGATIGGGGCPDLDSFPCNIADWPNQVTWSLGTVSGGAGNTAGSAGATVGGGFSNTASGSQATVGGGRGNNASSISSTVGGGIFNTANGGQATVGGGWNNTASETSSTVGGGVGNSASGFASTVGGGDGNTASDISATVGGGEDNTANGVQATVGGGFDNTASNTSSTVGGGLVNTTSGFASTVAGGGYNTASGSAAAVGGGFDNTASGLRSTIPGGENNEASGSYSFAAGRRAKAEHTGAFVWADNTNADFVSTGIGQFLIRAGGGVGIGTDSPERALHVRDAVSSASLILQNATGTDGWGIGTGIGSGNFNFYYESDVDGFTTSGTRLGGISNATGEYSSNSDRRLKQDIEALGGVLADVLKLEPTSYRFRRSADNGPRTIGFLAQDVQEVFPELPGGPAQAAKSTWSQARARRRSRTTVRLDMPSMSPISSHAVYPPNRLAVRHSAMRWSLSAIESMAFSTAMMRSRSSGGRRDRPRSRWRGSDRRRALE